jgi:hypothetical protein
MCTDELGLEGGTMRAKISVGVAMVLVSFLMTSTVGVSHAATPTLTADWEMNEPAGTTVMNDTTGNHPGVVNPAGVTANGSSFHWQQRCPACLPTAIERVITVNDSPELDITDPSVNYTLEFRYHTRGGYGNIMQKGQSSTAGGQIKVQLPQGRPQCLFKGANGQRVGSGSPVAINDGQWHTVMCVHSATQVLTYVDGVRMGVKNGSTGPIDNSKPFVIGGKLNCDQIKTTCDYFSGDIDWVRITRG